MKISQKFELAEKENRVVWSFEYFPPRTAQGLQNLYDRIERMREMGPEFIDITWGAGGKNSDLTLSLVQVCQQTIGMETCMHLCCTEMPEDKVKESLRIAKEHGCQNILALRGDPPNGQSEWTPTPGGFSKAIDLVKYIRAEYGDYFDVAVAGFPQGHPETPEGEDDKRKEIEYLKAKVDAGGNFIFTQMFYDVGIFVDWVKRVRAAGITVPIVPGIMPIQSWQKFMTWVKRESIIVPQHFWDVLLPVKDNDEAVREVGTKLVAQMCRDILEAGVGIRGLHVYTLNLEKGARMLLEELKMESRREQVHPLPWRPSLTPNRRGEAIRPIFWANRQQSYLSRTEDWDEFPNGRWGDSRSPAYGDLDGYPVKIDVPGNDALELWGEPKEFSDITSLFAKFCRNELRALPWSSQPPSKETSVIDQQLAKMNELGYLTINSQPAVDGARSEDPTHGWGPAGGYVYQKAYLEFFVAPNLLDELVRRIEKDPRITYYAVNRQGDLRTNTHSEGPNAVTWGVFPGKEIIQPTIVEAVSFIAWKDEAFELGMQWANLYDEQSPSRQLIKDVMNDSYLVNIVANDFKDGLSIFEPFQLDRVIPAAITTAVDSASHAASKATQSVVGAASAVANGVAKLVNGGGSSSPNGVETNGHAAANEKNGTLDEERKTDGNPEAAASPDASVYDPKPDDDTSKESIRQESTPKESTSKESAPKDSNPKESEPKESEPRDSKINRSHGAGPAPKVSKTLDELFDTTPLFMREAPAADGEENSTLEALKSLIFDGTPDEVAQNFKEQATERHQLGQLRDALSFYTQGLEAQPEDRQLRLSLLLNRSACNLSLSNFGSVLRDTGAVLKESPNSPKAYFRAASALLALSRWNDAIDCINRGKALPSEAAEDKQKTWEGLEAKARKGLTGIEERTERERRDRVGKEALRRALQARGLIQTHSASPPANPTPAAFDDSNTQASIPLVQAAVNPVKWYPPGPDHPIVYPAFLMYPEHATSDLIARFHEDTTFYDQLEIMFPVDADATKGGSWAEWDKSRQYYCDNLVVYAETNLKKLLKIGRSLTLRDVIAKAAGLEAIGQDKDGLVMSDGLLSFVVVPKGEAEKTWVEKYKQSRG